MTVQSSTARVTFNCDGVTTVFPVNIQAYFATDFLVLVTVGGITTVFTSYSLTASGSLSPTYWTLTTTTSTPLAIGNTLQVILNPSQTQLSVYSPGIAFPSSAVQANLDRLTQMTIREQDQLNRSIRAPDGDISPAMLLPSAAARANATLSFDVNGNLQIGTTLPPGTVLTAAAIGVLLYPVSSAETLAGVTPTNQTYPVGNVLRYGADSTGVNASDAAIRSAIAVACAASGASGLINHARVYFPPGQYTVTTTNVFGNPIWPTTIRGVLFQGAGNGSSCIYLKTNGTNTLWLFDGTGTENTGSHQQNWLTCTWQDLYFTADNGSLGNGWRSFTSQGCRFVNCYFNSLYTIFDTEAAVGQGFGGDSWLWFFCKVTNIAGPAVIFNNSQAFNMHFHGCAMEQMTGNVFQVNANGGGGMEVYGGSYLLQGSLQTWLLNISAGAALADNNNRFMFRDLDISLQQTFGTAGLLNNGGLTGQEATRVVFDGCSIQQVGVANQQSVINVQGHVEFVRCALTVNQGMQYLCYGPASGGAQYGDSGSIIFSSCEVPLNLYAQCQTPVGADNLPWGYISARDCYASSFVSGTPRFNRFAVDFDMNWPNVDRAFNVPRLKRASGYISNYAMPAAGGSSNEWTLTLPATGYLVNAYVSRAATASSASYNLTLATGSGVLAVIAGSNTNVSQTLNWSQTSAPQNWLNLAVSNNNIVTISTTAAVTDAQAGSGPGNYFVVEYY